MKRHGFTLIELLTVVVIVGILAAVAIPLYSLHIKKSRTSEVPMAFAKIASGEEIYFMEKGTYRNLAQNPCGDCNSTTHYNNFVRQTSDDSTNCAGTGVDDYSNYWGLDGVNVFVSNMTYFNYMVAAGNGPFSGYTCTSSAKKNHNVYTGTNIYLFNCGMVDAGGANLEDAVGDYWFIMQAQGDHDPNATIAYFHRSNSMERIYQVNELD